MEGHVSPTAGNRLHDVVEITLDSPWGDLEKRVTFYRGDSCDCRRHDRHEVEVTVEWDGTSQVVIPWEVLQEAGSFGITVVGSEDGEDRLVTYAMPKLEQVRVILNGEDEGIEPSEPTEDILHNVQRIANELEGSEAKRQQEFEAAQATRSSDYINASSAMAHQFSTSMGQWGREFYTKASEADAAATRADQAASDIREQAGRGEFDGADGVSPTANVQRVDGGAVITVTDKDGTTTAEVYDGHNAEGGGKVQDVQVAGATVLDENGVANIPIAEIGTYGVINPRDNSYGLAYEDGRPRIVASTQNGIKERVNYTPITPSNLDYAVKAAMGDNKGVPWDATTKKNAQKRMGVDELERRVNILEAATEGKTHIWELVNEDSSATDVPAELATKDGKGYADLVGIEGKTVVWNQLIDGNLKATNDGITTEWVNNKLRITNNSRTENFLSGSTRGAFTPQNALKSGHVFAYVGDNISGICLYSAASGNVELNSVFTASADFLPYLRIRSSYNFATDHPVGDVTECRVMLFDLTQMFGAGNEPANVEQFRAMFPDDYYPYNPGELMSMEVAEVESMGKNMLNPVNVNNLYPETPASNFTDEGKLYNSSGDISVWFDCEQNETLTVSKSESSNRFRVWGTYDENPAKGVTCKRIASSDTATSITFNTGEHTKIGIQVIQAGAQWPAWIQVERGTTATDYAPYVGTVDNITVPSVNLKSAGTAKDRLDFMASDVVRKVGVVDLGTLNYTYSAERKWFYTSGLASVVKMPAKNVPVNAMSAEYEAVRYNTAYDDVDLTGVVVCHDTSGRVSLKNTAYTNATDFKAAMQGVMLYYELAEPTTETVELPDSWLTAEANGSIRYVDADGKPASVPHSVQFPIKVV